MLTKSGAGLARLKKDELIQRNCLDEVVRRRSRRNQTISYGSEGLFYSRPEYCSFAGMFGDINVKRNLSLKLLRFRRATKEPTKSCNFIRQMTPVSEALALTNSFNFSFLLLYFIIFYIYFLSKVF